MVRDGGGGIGTAITWAAILGGGYLIYQWWQSQQPQAAQASTAPPSPTPTAIANASTPAPGASSVSRLDALYAAMVQAANAANPWVSVAKGHPGTLNPDQWGYYLGQVAGSPAPDALQAFPSYNRSTNWPNISAAQYWAGIAPLVAQQMGMSGLGLFGGLGRLAMGRR